MNRGLRLRAILDGAPSTPGSASVPRARIACGIAAGVWGLGRWSNMARKSPDDVSIGKFDIFATYAYARARHDGLSDVQAKERGIVAAVMGAKARLGLRGGSHEEYQSDKTAAEKKKKTTITAESFDHQVADKMGEFFNEVFLPAMKKLVGDGMSYDEVKRLVKIPSTWGAKITGGQFRERVADHRE